MWDSCSWSYGKISTIPKGCECSEKATDVKRIHTIEGKVKHDVIAFLLL